MKIIMLAGKAGAGKDTSYIVLSKLYKDTKRYAFADALKDVAYQLSWDGLKDDKGRRFLQNLGNVAREYNKNVWADIVADDIEQWGTGLAVITDFRFPNEYYVIENRFPKQVYTINIYGRAYDLGKNGNDVSENSLTHWEFDFQVNNDSTIENLQSQLSVVMERIM